MLKTVLYSLLVLTTSLRLVDIVYLLVKDSTNLPIPVIVVAAAMIIYGIALIVRKFFSAVRIKHLVNFFLIQSVFIIFNLCYLGFTSPLQFSFAETLLVGTLLELLINGVLLYISSAKLRSNRIPFAVVTGKRGINA